MKEIEIILHALEEGQTNPFAVFINLHQMSNKLDKAIEMAKKSCLKHFEKNSDDGGKTVECNGFVFRKTSSGRYKYDNNPNWVNLYNTVKLIEQKMQLSAKTVADFIDVETGEVVPKAEYIPSKTSLKIEMK